MINHICYFRGCSLCNKRRAGRYCYTFVPCCKEDENLVENSGSERLKMIHACVNQIKASEEMGVKYMQKWEEKILDREEGKEEATLICLQNLMTNLKLPMEEALVILGVPKEDWEKYLQLNQ